MAHTNTKTKGNAFEILAREYLIDQNYNILECNFRCKFGELDIIAMHNNVLCFIEVRSTKTDKYGGPLATVGNKKQTQIIKVANYYIMTNNISDTPIRFDVCGIIEEPMEIILLQNAFETHYPTTV